MVVLGLILFATMTSISALHFYWDTGGLWPAKTPGDLIKTVVGLSGTSQMPPRGLTFVVAALIFIGGCVPLFHIFGVNPGFFPMASRLTLGVLCVVFLLRGLVTYLYPPSFSNSAQPFRALNFRYFSPLCLILGAGFLVVVLYS